MRKAEAVLAVVLVVPLALYFVPYAYASATQVTYVVNGPPISTLGGQLHNEFQVKCSSPSDFTLHYTDRSPEEVPLFEVVPLDSGGGVANTGETPNGWIFALHNAVSFGVTTEVDIYCQSPVTVAGIGVPEFGSLYAAIALGAVVFFLMSRYMSGKKPIGVPASIPQP